MRVFEDLCPAPPAWTLRWDAVIAAFPWVRRMVGVPQDPRHHGEGDVAVHTRMACEALAASSTWRARAAGERVRLFATVLLHDAAKPDCTQVTDDGAITAHGHSRRGDLHARRVLWELGAPVAWREHVAALVRHHQVPFWAFERPDLAPIAFRVSLLARNDDLVELATADIRGRICGDAETLVDNVTLYGQWCAEAECLDRPRPFASDHARFDFFRHPGRDPGYAAYDDTRFTVTVMSGLPGAGKDTWVAEHRPDQPVVSLDGLRRSMGVPPAADQSGVLATAREQARTLLRAGRPFVWNATNVTKSLRGRAVALCADYHARVEIVSVEAPPEVVYARNRARDQPVPQAVIDRLAGRWEAPDPTEAHRVTWVVTG
ncbi:MAG TPA: AAA family ATPase [Micromonosporaceae bacterium]|nr:AAA family ATPase [Micromonosporaceae bacterium]